jgi:hypothetical protein
LEVAQPAIGRSHFDEVESKPSLAADPLDQQVEDRSGECRGQQSLLDPLHKGRVAAGGEA